MNFISRLMPREGRFFSLFDSHANLIMDGANALADVCATTKTTATARRGSSSSKTPSTRPTAITHETMQLLHKTFITPFDRDDIHRLISRMDDMLDLIQDAAESLVLYDIQKVTPEATQLAELLLRCVERVQAAVKLHGVDGRRAGDAQDLRGDRQARIRRRQGDARGDVAAVPRGDRRAPGDQAEGDLRAARVGHRRCEDVANIIEGVVLENA